MGSLTLLSGRENPELVYDLCVAANSEPYRRAIDLENYATDWHSKTHTLLWQFHVGRLARIGADYLILVDKEGRPVCGAGYYVTPELTPYTSSRTMCMVRMWTSRAYRTQFIGTQILEHIAQRALTPMCMMTFNEHNYSIYLSLTGNSKGLRWPSIWKAFKAEGRAFVNGVSQWCAVARTEDLTLLSV